jgi:hypothetical protein
MTAEIVIMNREAVAIAADSAVSLLTGMMDRPQKIFTSANKIFGFPPSHSVCIMIYNNAGFMGIPWETVISMYRKKLGPVPFGTIPEYTDHFLGFLTRDGELVTGDVEENFFLSNVYNYFLFIRSLVQSKAAEILQIQKAISEDDVRMIAETIVNDIHAGLSAAPFSESMDESHAKEIAEQFDEKISRAMSEVFENLPVSDRTVLQLREIPVLFFVKAARPLDPLSQNFSGVVLAGFGEKDIFPSLIAFSIEGRIGNVLKYAETERSRISLDNAANIIPFAQREMVDIFLSGMDLQFERALISSLSATFHELPNAIIDSIDSLSDDEKAAIKTRLSPTGDALVKQLSDQLEHFRAFNYVPIINVVSSLPKSELAAMAESMVNLTSLKRKVSMQAETVGGPVDVAVISKSDGFIWIKRKQYYKPDLNTAERFPAAGGE